MYGRSFVAALLATTTLVSISTAADRTPRLLNTSIAGNTAEASGVSQSEVRILATVGTPGITLSKLAIETGG